MVDVTRKRGANAERACSLARQGEICDIEGRCVDASEDELFKLTTKGGKLVSWALILLYFK